MHCIVIPNPNPTTVLICYICSTGICILQDSNSVEINIKTTKKVAERYFDVDSFKSTEQKLVWAQIQIIFKATYVLLLTYQESVRASFTSTDQLLAEYPWFASLDGEELRLLVNFKNMVRVALRVIPARLNKQCILKIAGRLEGSQNEYITGGGQKPCVTRRVDIYEREGGISAERRPVRAKEEIPALSTGATSGTGTKRSASALSDKKLKLVRMQTEEMRQLCRGPVNHFPMNPDQPLPISQAQPQAQSQVQSQAQSQAQSQVQSQAQIFQELFCPLSTLSAAACTVSQRLHLQEGLEGHTRGPGGPETQAHQAQQTFPSGQIQQETTFPRLEAQQETFPLLQRENSDALSAIMNMSDPCWREMFEEAPGIGSGCAPLNRGISMGGMGGMGMACMGMDHIGLNFGMGTIGGTHMGLVDRVGNLGTGGMSLEGKQGMGGKLEGVGKLEGMGKLGGGVGGVGGDCFSEDYLFPQGIDPKGMPNVPLLQRGFSLGFYTTFSDDLRALMPLSPDSKCV
ncbi:hypothetical protein B484DRAFT_444271 [Ochromonadaceae sp. CCMP2298]|nr:hypothetical protein B484DRAFT_451991 [Ochromonadaceae sp. CCMP2298]KAJ1438879.1 hypothetical protein B484DRAFT_444271 [Ochromonadaceae sp. CCMP2298]